MRLSALLTFNRGQNLFLPAHGRGAALPREFRKLLRQSPGVWDLPELPDIGSTLVSTGAIAISQEKSAKDFGVDHCWYGVNGATGLLQASLLSMAKPSEAVLMPRNIHRSLIQACVLGDIQPILFDLPYMADRGHTSPPDLNWLNKVLNSVVSSGIKIVAAVLVNPTYHGYASDLTPLIERLHNYGISVLVDEAHGTYFAANISRDLPHSALRAGADLVVHSLHKSSTGIGQTAVLWSQGNLIDPITIERSLGMFQTTSPSSLLLSSCEATLRDLCSRAGQRRLISQIDSCRDVYSRLLTLGVPLLKTDDPLRIILHTSSEGISGFRADDWFIKKRIVAELPEPGTLTFCMGFASPKGFVRALDKQWHGMLEKKISDEIYPPFTFPKVPFLTIPRCSCSLASRGRSHFVLLNDAVGSISADLICPYPPGIPIVIPGESLDHDRVNWMIEQNKLWPNQIPSQIRVLY
ncbi:lysine decarboxylase [Prochlorococcus marinus]|uniref:Orn/Lys/Arg decarboxylase family 1 n=1 Tax=Prochlorococcus marinus (strain MIT 9211) TaxID=93059 RepID=A9BB21_PROM4|nr:lysine decarboxylase [Prochlorococcus marinus]ABX09033.1 Orn/Lys/Arg decarboxylase family 1 [Prochlorococcus marinus str. MIT 9211]